jgi:2-polyprenyl-3-methyl-5-hydroxy-6-metoxy-1,4-benzoquinol methylase
MTGARPHRACCPVCRGPGAAAYRTAALPRRLRCDRCGLVWQPAAAEKMPLEQYEDGYREWWGELREAQGAKLQTFDRLLRLLERHVDPGRLLDVGCGAGLLLQAAADRGWDVCGLEISRGAARTARDIAGEACVVVGGIEAVRAPSGAFRAVTMTDVLEHLPDPTVSLRRCHDLLAPGGCLLVTTPHMGCLSERLMGPRWFQVKDEHLQLFTQTALDTALKRSGLEPLCYRPVRKVLSLAFVAAHFRAYPSPVLTPVLSGLARCLGPLAHRALPLPTGELLAIARRPIPQCAPSRDEAGGASRGGGDDG